MLTNIGIRAKQAERVLMTASTNIKNKLSEILLQLLLKTVHI